MKRIDRNHILMDIIDHKVLHNVYEWQHELVVSQHSMLWHIEGSLLVSEADFAMFRLPVLECLRTL